MPAIPDVIGLPLDDARARLTAAGIAVRDVTETRPPAPPPRQHGDRPMAVELAGALRVIRVRGDGPVDLVVTRERYVPGQGTP